jgi:hypothetical protein
VCNRPVRLFQVLSKPTLNPSGDFKKIEALTKFVSILSSFMNLEGKDLEFQICDFDFFDMELQQFEKGSAPIWKSNLVYLSISLQLKSEYGSKYH